ncbi:MAG: RNA 2'-phosphotransferase, partial [Halanaerobiales bacterium]|nr:RNA 2'-phosphotransferase [Halanaerobiales bacterium]
LKMEIDGSVKINELMNALRKDDRFNKLKYEDIKRLVKRDQKNRFTILKTDSETKLIKANYGHSIDDIDLEYENIRPTEYLYHGTIKKYYKNILKQGLKKMNRKYVHLSKNKKQAYKVGKRRTQNPLILKIEALKMYNDGHNFFKTNSDIILTEFVDKQYISLVNND